VYLEAAAKDQIAGELLSNAIRTITANKKVIIRTIFEAADNTVVTITSASCGGLSLHAHPHTLVATPHTISFFTSDSMI
jgi:hypothetical protein